jgi:hypothetical protein
MRPGLVALARLLALPVLFALPLPAPASAVRPDTRLQSEAGGDTVPCARYVIIHDAHEGSHALDQAFGAAYGTFSFLEIADGRETGSLTEEVLEAFATGDQPRLALLVERAYRNMKSRRPSVISNYIGIKDVDCASGRVMGALARESKPAMYAHPGVAIFLIVRTDLMRWALSLTKSVTSSCPHPQFGGCNDAGKHRVNLVELKNTARKLVSKWKRKSRFAQRIARGEHLGPAAPLDCSRVYVVTYEAFLESKDRVVRSMFSHVQRASALAKAVPMPSRRVFKKVHSENISDWVENYQEVEKMFRLARFPLWADILQETGFTQLCPQLARPPARR